jgi:hypothetical protein
MSEDEHVRITRPGAFEGIRGIVVSADDERRVAEVLLDEDCCVLPPPYGVVGTVEEDYEFLELIAR